MKKNNEPEETNGAPEIDLNTPWKRFHARMAKQSDDWWIGIWQIMTVAAFFAGITVSAHYAEHQANEQLAIAIQDFIDNNPCLLVYNKDVVPLSVNISGYQIANQEQETYDDELYGPG